MPSGTQQMSQPRAAKGQPQASTRKTFEPAGCSRCGTQKSSSFRRDASTGLRQDTLEGRSAGLDAVSSSPGSGNGPIGGRAGPGAVGGGGRVGARPTCTPPPSSLGAVLRPAPAPAGPAPRARPLRLGASAIGRGSQMRRGRRRTGRLAASTGALTPTPLPAPPPPRRLCNSCHCKLYRMKRKAAELERAGLSDGSSESADRSDSTPHRRTKPAMPELLVMQVGSWLHDSRPGALLGVPWGRRTAAGAAGL